MPTMPMVSVFHTDRRYTPVAPSGRREPRMYSWTPTTGATSAAASALLRRRCEADRRVVDDIAPSTAVALHDDLGRPDLGGRRLAVGAVLRHVPMADDRDVRRVELHTGDVLENRLAPELRITEPGGEFFELRLVPRLFAGARPDDERVVGVERKDRL